MGIIGIWRALGLAGKIATGVIAILVVTVALWWAWDAITARQRIAEAKVEARTQSAYTASTRAALDVVVAATKRDEETQKEITDAVASIQTLPEAERLAASLRLLCGMREYARDPRCSQLQRPDSK